MEITTTAFDHAQAPRRVKDVFGSHLILFCPLRDPVDRAYQTYQRYLEYGIVSQGIEQACIDAPQILHASRYADHLALWFEQFSDIYVFSCEDLESDKNDGFKGVCERLALSYQPYVPKTHWLRALPKIWLPKSPQIAINDDEYAWLESQLADEKGKLKALIKKDIFSS